MNDKQTYAFMAAAAYDERRGSAGDDHVMAIETYLGTQNGGSWFKENRGGEADGASYSDPATGMQADVWANGTQYVIANQNTQPNPPHAPLRSH